MFHCHGERPADSKSVEIFEISLTIFAIEKNMFLDFYSALTFLLFRLFGTHNVFSKLFYTRQNSSDFNPKKQRLCAFQNGNFETIEWMTIIYHRTPTQRTADSSNTLFSGLKPSEFYYFQKYFFMSTKEQIGFLKRKKGNKLYRDFALFRN